MNIPEANVISVRGKYVDIACPYCDGRKHEHKLHRKGRQHFAPKCGMFRTPDQRAAGYTFTVPPGA